MDPPQQHKRRKLSVNTGEVASSSPMEKLPRELHWYIMEYASESLFSLRATSKILLSRVAEYARENLKSPLATELGFEGDNTPFITARIVIPIANISLFEMRLRSRNPPFNLHNSIERLHLRSKRPYSKPLRGPSVLYSVKFDAATYYIGTWEYIVECMGYHVSKVSMHYCEAGIIEAVFKLQEHVQFSKLRATYSVLTQQVIDNLLITTREHNVEHVSLTADKVAVVNKSQFLMDLSSMVRSININSSQEYYARKPLFGIDRADWPSIIIGLFNNKLDKLQIKNTAVLHCPAADTLAQELLSIGKKIWFTTTLGLTGCLDYIMNEHSVEAYPVSPEHSKMTIIHQSRTHETCDF